MRLSSIFKSLNIQFVFYFLLFSYIPLLIFSVLGYYLNKNLISSIHNTNIEEINHLTAKRVEDLFSFNRDRAKIYVERQTANSQLPDSENVDVSFMVFDTTKIILNSGINDDDERYLIRTVGKTDQTILLTPTRKIFQIMLFKKDESIVFELNIKGIQDRLKSGYEQGIQHYLINKTAGIVITDSGFTIDKTGKKTIRHEIVAPPDQRSSIDSEFISETMIDDGFILYSLKPDKGLYKDLEKFLLKIIIANLFIGLLVFFIALFFSHRITNPIRSLVKAVHEISSGDMSHPITVKSNDEIKILADEFEQMRQRLKESYTDLESKIEDRTKALRDAQFQISHQEKMASLGLLAAGVAHEIGNPLTSISSMAQIIKRKVKDQNFIEYLNTILKNIERIRKIVRELVDFARPSSYEAGETDINELIRNAVGIVKYDRRAKSINIDLELDNNLPTLYLVADQLMQVFINILINAVDALTEEKNRIIIRSFKKGTEVVLQFEDSGIGIDEENLTKIFEPFFTTKKVGKGTGLGLSVSYGIIKNLDGKIEVQSEPGVGSTFTITLPRSTRRS